jgi:ankyrin repeat protein
MDLKPLPYDSGRERYEAQAAGLLAAYRAGDAGAIEAFRRHPRFLDPKIKWLSTNPTDEEVLAAGLGPDDARLAVARLHDFRDWPALVEFANAVAREGSPVARFEAAVEAVVDGDVATLSTMLREEPGLVRARSTRVTHFDPPVHRATLLHYVAANGVEGYRQRTPKNAVDVAKSLRDAGAEVDALADLYGQGCTTMSLLVSSCHPAEAGLQVPLANLLLDYGASIEGDGSGRWSSPLMTALAFGYTRTADALAARGARTDTLPAAAGLGRVDDARRLLPAADAGSRHKALALAAQHGQVEAVRLLLDAGEDPNRFNPEGNHSHSTPLHQAALAGHHGVVRLLVERGARLDVRDASFQGTPLGWALQGGQHPVAEFLRSRGAK